MHTISHIQKTTSNKANSESSFSGKSQKGMCKLAVLLNYSTVFDTSGCRNCYGIKKVKPALIVKSALWLWYESQHIEWQISFVMAEIRLLWGFCYGKQPWHLLTLEYTKLRIPITTIVPVMFEFCLGDMCPPSLWRENHQQMVPAVWLQAKMRSLSHQQ